MADRGLPIHNSHPQEEEKREFSYAYLGFKNDGSVPAPGRWSEGQSIDGNDGFETRNMEPQGEVPNLGRTRPGTGAQANSSRRRRCFVAFLPGGQCPRRNAGPGG